MEESKVLLNNSMPVANRIPTPAPTNNNNAQEEMIFPPCYPVELKKKKIHNGY